MNKLKLFQNLNIRNSVYKTVSTHYSTKKHNTNFDYHLDWLIKKYFSVNFGLVKSFALINAGLFFYCWLRPTEAGRYEAQDRTSFSKQNLINRDYLNLFCSLVGSRRIDDFLFDTAVLFTIGSKLEKIHGIPFIFKISLFSFYIGGLSSIFWIKKCGENERYKLEDPNQRKEKLYNDYKYMSGHNLTAALLYFYLFKYYRALVPVAALVDLSVWGPYYSSGLMTGLAFGIIL